MGPNGGPGGRTFYWGARERPLGRAPKKEVLGGELWGAQGRFGWPQRDFEIVEKLFVFSAFELLNPSDAAKGTKKNATWWTLMQAKRRRYQESRRNKWQLLQNQQRDQGVSQNTKKECPKATAIIGRWGLKTMLLQKYCFYFVKLCFWLLPQTRFCLA